MQHFRLIVNSYLRTVTNSLASLNLIRLISFIFVIACFFLGSYYLFFRVFTYLVTVEVIGTVLMDRLIEMALFIFFAMLVFSNIITSFSTLFNSRELQFLFSLPIRSTSIYLAKLLENCIYASWATIVIALPLLIAYGVAVSARPLYYPFALINMLIYLIIPAAVASTILILLLRLFPRLSSREVMFISLTLIAALSFLYIKISNPQVLKIFETESEVELLKFAANLSTVGGTYLPSTWITGSLKGFSTGSVTDALFYSLLLLFVTVSVIIIAYVVARILYAHSWLYIGDRTSRQKRRRSLLTNPHGGPTQTFFLKDVLLFIREPTQWVQLSIFIVLLGVYIFSLRRTPLYFKLPIWRTVVSFANFSYICFVLATLGVRFIFPAISLERNGMPFLLSSPFTVRRTVMIKYLGYLVMAVVIMEGLLLLSNMLIHTDPRLYIIMPFIALVCTAALVSINMGFGCRFPQFNEDNPSKIAAGSGGIITALASVAYVGITMLILATPAYNYLSSTYLNRPSNTTLMIGAFIAFTIMNICAIILPLRIGIRALEKRDY